MTKKTVVAAIAAACAATIGLTTLVGGNPVKSEPTTEYCDQHAGKGGPCPPEAVPAPPDYAGKRIVVTVTAP